MSLYEIVYLALIKHHSRTKLFCCEIVRINCQEFRKIVD